MKNNTVHDFLLSRIPSLSALAVAALAAFYPAFGWLYGRFVEPGSYYSHGFLIPFVVLFLVWQRRYDILDITVSSDWRGLLLIVGGMLLHLAGGVLLRIGFFSGIAFIIVLFGISLYLFGAEAARRLFFPIGFLLTMIPLPTVLLIGIAFKMKMLAAQCTAWVLQFMSVQVRHAGSIFQLPGGDVLVVEDECSGINSLVSLCTLGILIASGIEGVAWRRAAVVLSSLPVAIFSNVARITVMVVIAYVYGAEAPSKSFFHFGTGIVMWGAAIGMFAAVGSLFSCKKTV